ncbi:MAG: diphosphomevalonate decarboxylase [Gammaproteobacteria bacterium]|nr:diphosphomevalonate decarboxylase [Gammaproteobacteria bacterium]
MRATAIAQPNIALIKYWGKRDIARNLPAVGSISITLSELFTEMQVHLDAQLSADTLTVNGQADSAMLPRLSDCIDRVLGDGRPSAAIRSRSNFPIAAGLASSASAFAAITVAAVAAAGRSLPTSELASLAGRASGSAARSLYGGFVELTNSKDDIAVRTIAAANDWPLSVVVAITAAGPKAVGSTEAMEASRKTSPFYSSWVEQQEQDLAAARQAIGARDFLRLAAVAEHNCLKMHSVMWTSRPPVVYWNSATMRCLQAVRDMQADGLGVFFTMDAGPQVKAVCLPEDADAVRASLESVDGVTEVMVSALGDGARLVESA